MIYSALRLEHRGKAVKAILSGDHCSELALIRSMGSGFSFILIGGRGVCHKSTMEGVTVRLTASGNTAVEWTSK